MPGLAVPGRDFHSDKMTLHIFNPENDMALADGGSGYTAPATIRQMRDELHWLPLWWAKDDDLVWNGEDRITLSDGDEIRPWGWSAALVHQLKQAGVDEKFLPSPDQLDSLRRLSHRQTAVEALAQALKSVIYLIDPGKIVLYGHLFDNSYYLARFMAEMREGVDSRHNVPIEKSRYNQTLENSAAGLLMVEKFFELGGLM
mgnify:CR=1 FL=1